ncbi:alpha-amylase family glycosyl hydrolase [Bacteroidota bacterium]
MKKISIMILVLIITTFYVNAQSFKVEKVEPPNWWVNMQWGKVQLMIYGSYLAGINASFNTEDITIEKIYQLKNNSCSFIDIMIKKNIKSDTYILTISKGKEKVRIKYPIFERDQNPDKHQGFDNEDVIYLLMPDRFVNGNINNDSIEGYTDTMQNIPTQSRHGGDIQGVINKLDYLKDLGITTIWLTPLLENNTFRSYHGYAATDHYLIDPRLGDHNLYVELILEAHRRDLKIIMDHVSNHISEDHHWMADLPMEDWINGTQDNHPRANHNKMVYTDIHGDSSIIREVQEGWFTNYMPDLNQANPFVANYLIQNTIWWIESSGIDGIREDTYPYSNQKFMSDWAKAVLDEYPNFNIVGEVWTGESAFLAGYQRNPYMQRKINSFLPAVTDFAIRDALVEFLIGKGSLYKIFNVFTKDYLYHDSNNLVVFIDNHDVGRSMFYADTNVAKFKLAFHLLLTTRGIPQIFYGTEIGMIENEDHGTLRKNFPGGFPGDKSNAFLEGGRTDCENEIFNYFQNLLSLRKKYKSLSKGKLIHFPPHYNVYIYFKDLDGEKILNIVNANERPMEIDLGKYFHLFDGAVLLKNLNTSAEIDISGDFKITVSEMSAEMFELIRN